MKTSNAQVASTRTNTLSIAVQMGAFGPRTCAGQLSIKPLVPETGCFPKLTKGNVISLLKNWMFLASVKAEIYAQHRDQGFVDRVSQFRPSAMLLLESMTKSPQLQVEAGKVRAFLGAGGILALAIGADDLSQSDRDTAAGLLVHRLSKVNSDSVFRNFHGLTIGSWDTSLANFSKETEGDNK